MIKLTYSNIRVVALLLTTTIFLVHYVFPERRIVIHPLSNALQEIYGFLDPVTGKSSRFIDKEKYTWECNYKTHHRFGCGWHVYWDKDHVRGLDLGNFDVLELNMTYTGAAKRARIYMRNFNESYADRDDPKTSKFLSMTLRLAEGTDPVRVNLSEFRVASWWLKENNVRWQWSRPEFSNITQIGVDFIENGKHQVSIQKITLIGEWIKTKTLLYAIIIFWMGVFLLEGFVRFFQLYRRSVHERHLIRELRIRQYNLDEEKENLTELASRDPLTAILNRTGIQPVIYDLIHNNLQSDGFGLMVLDLDFLKKVNERYGHDIGDLVLKHFAASVSNNLRETDYFARWGGEEFIIICHLNTADSLTRFGEKLREVVDRINLKGYPDLHVTVSIGMTVAHPGDSFDEIFKRADTALFRAKSNGRNMIEYEG